MFSTILLLTASLLGPGVAPSADLSVDLDARSIYLLPGAYYDVTITNHGPDPVTSATVVVALDPRAAGTPTGPCVPDAATDTLTCVFGPVPAGGTATMTSLVAYLMSGRPSAVDATATRTASTPPDPNAGNDTDLASCWYRGPLMPPMGIPPLSC